MESRPFGCTGLNVPPLGLGTVKIGRNRGVKYPGSFELPDDAAVAALIASSLECGAVLWDTAPAYGISEERLGPHVEAHRDRILVCSKVGEEYDEGGSRFDFRPEAIRASVERSRRRLRTDRIDVVLLHSDGHDEAARVTGATGDALRELVERGQVGAVGISAKTAEGIDAAVERMDVVMAPLSAGDRSRENALRRARAAGLGVIAIKVLDQGHAVVPGTSDDPVRDALTAVWTTGIPHCMVVGTRDPAHLRHAARIVRDLEASRGPHST